MQEEHVPKWSGRTAFANTTACPTAPGCHHLVVLQIERYGCVPVQEVVVGDTVQGGPAALRLGLQPPAARVTTHIVFAAA